MFIYRYIIKFKTITYTNYLKILKEPIIITYVWSTE